MSPLLRLPLALACSATLAAAQGPDRGLYQPLNDFVLVSSGSANVELNGNVAVHAPTVDIDVNIDSNNVPTGVTAELVLAGGVAIDLTAEADGSFAQTLPIASFPLAPIQIGPNILVLPLAQIVTRVSGDASAGMRTSLVQEFEFSVDASFDVVRGFSFNAGAPEVIGATGRPEVQGSAAVEVEVEVGILFNVSYQGIFLGGPEVGANLSLQLEADPSADPWWSSKGHLVPFVGYASPLASTTFMPQVSVPLADAGGPLVGPLSTTRWSKVLEVDGFESVRSVLETPWGFVAVMRTSTDRPWIGELGPDGRFVTAQRTVLQSFGTQAVLEGLRPDDGSTILVGNTSNSGVGPRIERVTDDGGVLWSRTLTHPTASLSGVTDAVALPDGGFAVAGKATNVSPASEVAWVARFDANGRALWAREVQPGGGVTNSRADHIIRCANGDLVIAGGATFSEADPNGATLLNLTNVWIARLTENGDLVFGAGAGTTWAERATCLAEGEDGTLVVGSDIREGGSVWAGLYRFDAAGQFLGATAYRGEVTSLGFFTATALAPVEGGYLVAGNVGLGAAGDAFLSLVSDNGGVLWWKTLRGQGEDRLLGLTALDDGLVAHGTTLSLGPAGGMTDGWIVRTDVDGMLHFDGPGGFDAHNDQVWWGDWSDVQPATSLQPTISAFKFQIADAPLAMDRSTAVLTELVD